MPSCLASYVPVKTVAPKISGEMDSQFQGVVVVMVTIDELGRVANATLVTNDLRQLDRGKGDSSSYTQAVLEAVRHWTFPETGQRCQKEVKLRFSLT